MLAFFIFGGKLDPNQHVWTLQWAHSSLRKSRPDCVCVCVIRVIDYIGSLAGGQIYLLAPHHLHLSLCDCLSSPAISLSLFVSKWLSLRVCQQVFVCMCDLAVVCYNGVCICISLLGADLSEGGSRRRVHQYTINSPKACVVVADGWQLLECFWSNTVRVSFS